ncbi:MAG: hypothetical protein JXB88_05950 [Spirochaetales bacterium]|nr:hypothetical protein [Spirochaetales bacterium]
MIILTYGEIIEAGSSVFTCVAMLDDGKLVIHFKGVIQVDNPDKELASFIEELTMKLDKETVYSCDLDFTELHYCNSNGFYTLMDIIDVIYTCTNCSITIKRLTRDDWHYEILPILLNLDDMNIAERTSILEVS